jgi:3-oxoacyl-[acyl-carrier-protein] synthase-1
MVSPLGFTIDAAAAAARAGVMRLREIAGTGSANSTTGIVEPAIGHYIKGYTDGFSGLGRLVRLGLGALSDLRRAVGVIDWRRTGLFLTVSSGFYSRRLAQAAATQTEDPPVEPPTPETVANLAELYRNRLAPTLARHADVIMPSDNQHVILGDSTGIIELLERAQEAFASGKLRQAVVGAIDSLVEPQSIAALDYFGVLKTPLTSVGLIPGECAAFLLVEPVASREAAGERRCMLEGLATAREDTDRLSGPPAVGAALSSAIKRSLAALPNDAQMGFAMGALNGDPHRSHDFGHALVRCAGTPLADAYQWHTATAVGDTGAANGAAALCFSYAALQRGYARGDTVLTWLYDDTGSRGSACLRLPSNATSTSRKARHNG